MGNMRKVIVFTLWAFLSLAVSAQKHTEFVGLSLDMAPDELADGLVEKGMRRIDSCLLSGRIVGLDVMLKIQPKKDTVGCNCLLVTAYRQHENSLQTDYLTLMHWMKKHYGWPDWEGKVRSQPFARWFVDFDHDIVMIAAASKAIEIWFYENHETRNLDYYAILKYCERNPAPGIPRLTAQECVVWTSKPPVDTPRKVVKKKGRKSGRGKVSRHARSKHQSKRRRR